MASDELTAAQRRIMAAYDPLLLEKAGHRLAELLATHLDGAERSLGPVLPWVDPPQGIARAASLLHPSSEERRDTAGLDQARRRHGRTGPPRRMRLVA